MSNIQRRTLNRITYQGISVKSPALPRVICSGLAGASLLSDWVASTVIT